MAIGYKLFRIKKNEPGKLYPLYVFAEKEIPMNVWINAEEGPKNDNGKVKSKLGDLAYRPGWHINDKIPYVRRREKGKAFLNHTSICWIRTGRKIPAITYRILVCCTL